MDLGLSDKNVLVTGASRGIGYAISERFLQENADVLLVARNENKLHKTEKEFVEKFDKNRAWFRHGRNHFRSGSRLLQTALADLRHGRRDYRRGAPAHAVRRQP